MRIQRLNEHTRKNLLEDLLKRSPNQYPQYEERVAAILADVRERRDQAVFDLTKKFDGADICAENIEVSEEEIQEAYASADPSLLEILRKAKENIRVYHEKQKRYN